MRILIAGDFSDSHRVSDSIRKGDYKNLVDNVKPIIDQFEYNIVNFEFPIITSSGTPILKYGPNLCGQQKSIDVIKYAGFNVCTLANNHILDQGGDCCIETKTMLEEAGIKTVGVGKNISEAGEILYLKSNDEIVAIINCCENEFSVAGDKSPGANPLNPIRQFYKIQEAKALADYVVVIVHGGHEFFQLPSLRMVETYRFFVDAGADAIINHHQHCYSGYEIYHSKPIFYGLGNFLFDSALKRKTSWNEGFMLGLTLDEGCIDFSLFPYYQCKDTPTITLMNEQDKLSFFESIEHLNKIISNDKILRSELTKYYLSEENDVLKVFEPYSGRIFSKLYEMGLVPKFCRKYKKNALLNFIQCESHRDKVIGILKQNYDSDKKRT